MVASCPLELLLVQLTTCSVAVAMERPGTCESGWIAQMSKSISNGTVARPAMGSWSGGAGCCWKKKAVCLGHGASPFYPHCTCLDRQ